MKYAYSLKTQRIAERDFPYQSRILTCTAETVNFAKELQDADVEKMLVIFLDASNTIIGIHVFMGTLNQATIYPREVFKQALLHCAANLIIVHNHPSGNIQPSDADIRITKTIREVGEHLGIQLHDHIVIAGDKHYSFREGGLIWG